MNVSSVKFVLLGIVVFSSVFLFSFSKNNVYNDLNYIQTNLSKLNIAFAKLDAASDNYRKEQIDLDSLQNVFLQTRHQYKKIEFFLAFYHTDYINSAINAAPILHIERGDTNPSVVDPEGMQVLDELIFSESPLEEKHQIAAF